MTGETVTAALMNTLRDSLKAIGDPRTSYVPVWTASTTNPTLGNGTLVGGYVEAGKLVFFQITLTFGSTTTVGSGTYDWTVPVTAVQAFMPAGGGWVRNAANSVRGARAGFLPTTTTLRLADEAGAAVTHSTPMAWATGDSIRISGSYEAA